MIRIFSILVICGFSVLSAGAKPASVASIDPEDIAEYETANPAVRALIENALKLTDKKLTYQFGSNSPSNKGMDCSGTVQHTLQTMGLESVPRSSYAMYHWAEEQSELTHTPGVTSTDDDVFEGLKPGDLLFWEGTYETGDRNPPISHVMIFLGTLKKDGEGVVFGASDGRRYRGKKICGVSVFDWKVPSKGSSSKFVAYGPIPGFPDQTEEEEVEKESANVAGELKTVLELLFKKRQPSTR